jgi:hypothetical protein
MERLEPSIAGKFSSTGRRPSWRRPGFLCAVAWGILPALLLAACGTRERLTFPTQETGNGFGPTTTITVPDRSDTTVTEGDVFFVVGQTSDEDGIGTVFIELGGLDQAFSPIDGEGRDTVRFAIPLSTIGHFGDTAVVRVHGVDRLGDEGPPAVRQIFIR